MAAPKARISLLDPKFDFPQPAKPGFFYAIASVQRTGSTFLCQQLWQTGVLGAPWEYFNHYTQMIQMISRLEADSIDDYVERLFAVRTSPNGVFGFKMHPEHFRFLRLANLQHYFPGLRYLYVERREILLQAVSFAKALQTDQWNSLQVGQGRPEYNFRQIAACLNTIKRSKEYWENYFRSAKIQPVRINYEELTANPAGAVQMVLDKFEILADPSSAMVDIPTVEKLGDDTNQEWLQRFREDLKSRGAA